MDFDQLKYFVTIVETRSFTTTAKIHHITQPAVSRRIENLEKELGCTLLVRNNHTVNFTDAGREFYEYATSILNKTEAIRQRMDNIAQGRVGVVKVSIVPTSSHILRQVLIAFHQRYPMIQVDLDYCSGKEQILAISQNKYDFYFSFETLISAQNSLDYLVTDSDYFELYVPNQYAHLVNINDFSKMNQLPLLVEAYEYGPFLTEKVTSICKCRGYQTDNLISFNTFNTVVDFANSGLGFTLFPHALWRSVCTDHLVSFPLSDSDAVTTNAIGWNPNNMNDSTAKFLQVCKELFSRAGNQ